MGSIWIVTTLVTKTSRSMKSRLAIKTKACTGKTNNQASFGKSLLKNSIEVEAVMELSRHLDETGSPTVIGFACLVCIKFASSLPVIIVPCMQTSCLVWFLVQILCLVWTSCTKFAVGLHQNHKISWRNLTVLKHATNCKL